MRLETGVAGEGPERAGEPEPAEPWPVCAEDRHFLNSARAGSLESERARSIEAVRLGARDTERASSSGIIFQPEEFWQSFAKCNLNPNLISVLTTLSAVSYSSLGRFPWSNLSLVSARLPLSVHLIAVGFGQVMRRREGPHESVVA